MIKAAIDYVKKSGGSIVEAYPVEPKKDKMPDAFAWTGLASAFIKAGFTECARRSATRPIMRFYIEDEQRCRNASYAFSKRERFLLV